MLIYLSKCAFGVQQWEWFRWFYWMLKSIHRVSDIVGNISSGLIFALLPANAIFMAVSMFDMEQVTTIQFESDVAIGFIEFLWPFCSNSTDGSKNDRLRPLLNTTLILNNHFLCSNQQTTSHFELLVFMFDTSCIISALLWPFFFCYFANSVTNTIGSIGDIAYNSNWYDFPPNVQKHIMLVIARSQDSVYFSGLGLVRCTLEVYGEVSDSISS